jgi:Zn-finger nucleic acid-binding protein
VDHDRLQALIEKESRVASRPVRYIKCPVCRAHMNRRKYGSRSQVIVDRCKDHGVWLDGGELSQLLHWMKAGGQLHDDLRRREEAAARARAERMAKNLGPPIAGRELDATVYPGRGMRPVRDFDLGDIVLTALRLIF